MKVFNALSDEDKLHVHMNNYILIFYNNIDGVRFYDEPLGTQQRLARNVNAIGLFKNLDDIYNFFTNISLHEISSNNDIISDFSFKEKMEYFLIDYHEKLLKNAIVFEKIDESIRNNNVSITSLIPNDEKQKICKTFMSNISIFNEVTPKIFNLIEKIIPTEYKVYISKEQSNEQNQVTLYTSVVMNFLFSMFALSMNESSKVDVKMVELSRDELLQFFSLSMPNFEDDMNNVHKDTKEIQFPSHAIWKNMEIEFYNNIKDKSKLLKDVITDFEQNCSKVTLTDYTEEIIDFSDLLDL